MGAPHIVIVADEHETRELYSAQLHGVLQCVTSEAADIASARQLIGRHHSHCDVVVIDIGRSRNWQDCAAIARHDCVPVVVVTGWVTPDRRFRDEAFDSGCAGFVAKPCTAETLARAVVRACNGEKRMEYVEDTT
jgi:DNA-binding NtrC family response regulator